MKFKFAASGANCQFLALRFCMIILLSEGIYAKFSPKLCCALGKQFADVQINSSVMFINSTICSPKTISSRLSQHGDNRPMPKYCGIFARSCCIRQLRNIACHFGTDQQNECESITVSGSFEINQAAMECCLCCQPGNTLLPEPMDSCSILGNRCPLTSRTSTFPTVTEGLLDNKQTITDATDASISNRKSVFPGTTARTTSSQMVTEKKSMTSTEEIIAETQRTATKRKVQATTSNRPAMIQCGKDRQWNARLQVCVETIISCPSGFVLHPLGTKCVPVVLPKVPCLPGLQYEQFQKKCIDIDECRIATNCAKPNQICENTVGSFQCSCKVGYKLNKHTNECEDVDECLTADLCPKGRKCKNSIGSYFCSRIIPCGFGWKENIITGDCEDIDECQLFPDICGIGMKCVNIRGSHQCDEEDCPSKMKRNNRGICSLCRSGFFYNNKTDSCEDIDECNDLKHQFKGVCKITEVCVNVAGSYECHAKKRCRSGTVLSPNGKSCLDVDECLEMTFRCDSEQICSNTYGSYDCISSPCAPSQMYDYKERKCVCKDGFKLTGENRCEDINECVEIGQDNLCGSAFQCVNHPGGYNCINKESCPLGMYRSSTYSHCQDIDECETGEGKCPPAMHCVNMVGSYTCMCNRGYIKIKNDTCADINECILFRQEETCPDLEAFCINTPGGYKCECPLGFKWSNYPKKKCEDIDECDTKVNPCGKMHKCVNTIGSFKCICHKGYMVTSTGDACEDINECDLEPRRCPNGICKNLPGRYACQCPLGFVVDKNEICQDIDECNVYLGICADGNSQAEQKFCINLVGYHKCIDRVCPKGYSIKYNGNGFECNIDKESRCSLKDLNCLNSMPYSKEYIYTELITPVDVPRLLARVSTNLLPSGESQVRLNVKYAMNTITKDRIPIGNTFQIRRDRYNNSNVEILMRESISAPAEVSLLLSIKMYYGDMFLGSAETEIFLYFTRFLEMIN